MARTFNRSLLLSVVLHAALLGLGLRYWARRASPPRLEAPMPVSIWQSGPGASHSDGREPVKSRLARGRARIARRPRLKDLGVFSKGFEGAPSQAASADGVKEGASRSSPYAFEGQLASRSSPLLRYLYRCIDHGIAYPAELANAGMTGEVSVTLRFDAQGVWDPTPELFRAGDLGSRYLRVYLIHALARLLADPLPASVQRAEPGPHAIQARFIFAIQAPETVTGAQVGPQFAPSADPTQFSDKDTDGGQSIESQLNRGRQGMFGQNFLFYRVHLISPLAWKLGPLAGYGIMPAVGIDPSWFSDKISELIHHRARVDPLMKYRDDPNW